MIKGVAETYPKEKCLPSAGTEAGECQGRDCSRNHACGRQVSPGLDKNRSVC